MRVIIRFHEGCREDVLAWLSRLPGNIEDRRVLVDIAIRAMNEELVRTTGHPVDAVYREEPPPPCYWWKLSSGCWVRYTIVDSRGLFSPRTRTIEVIGFEPESPA
jgi:hypothetical protein